MTDPAGKVCAYIVEGGNISANFQEYFFIEQSLILVIDIPVVQFSSR